MKSQVNGCAFSASLKATTIPRLIVTTFQALLQPVPDREQLAKQRRRIKSGATVDLEELTAWLVNQGYERMEAVELPGEFSRRGGIVDVFSPDAVQPYRLEFLGDEVESIRPFTVQTQRAAWKNCRPSRSPPPGFTPVRVNIAAILPIICRRKAWSILVEPAELEEQGKHYL